MITIGIEKYHGLVYEGDGNYGRGVWPTPVITPACFVYPSEGDLLKAHSSSDAFGYRFREDSFDPIARIRRGRFYNAAQQQPMQWARCSHHPGFPLDAIDPQVHAKNKSLETFHGNPIWYKHIQEKQELPIVLLGVDDRFTAWTIINVEAIVTGEDLVTLKARNSFGVLPEIIEDKIPSAFKAKLNETLNAFADEIHRSSPISVIDRARDAAVYALLAYFNLQKDNALDLGDLIKKLRFEGRIIAENSANIVARLHARAKPSEQEKRDLRSIREQDADLAVQCVGALLCELGFAEWG
jgi:hypothetical protein